MPDEWYSGGQGGVQAGHRNLSGPPWLFIGGGEELATLHTLAISRAHQKIARKFMVRNNLPSAKEAIVKMIEIASAAHAATAASDDVGEVNGTKDAVSRQD